MRTIAAVVALMGATAASALDHADACAPLRFDRADITAESMARGMVADADTVQIMRAVSRTVIATDEEGIYGVGDLYAYRFEQIEHLNGRRRSDVTVHGLAANWLQLAIPTARIEAHEPLWWLTEHGYVGLQETRIPERAAVVCFRPTSFKIGAEYLVFRSDSGALLAPAFAGRRGHYVPQRPVIERLDGANDPWLIEVRRAIDRNPKSGPTFWRRVFEAIFGGAD